MAEHKLYDVKCAACGKSLKRRKRSDTKSEAYVCDLKCQRIWKSKLHKRITYCPICNEAIITTVGRIKHKVNRVFCCKAHHRKAQTMNASINTKHLSRVLVEYIKRRDGWQCRLCRFPFNQWVMWNPYFKKYPPHKFRLDVHHICRNKGDNPDNLVTLCVGCHRKADRNKEVYSPILQRRIRPTYLDNWREELFYMRKGVCAESPIREGLAFKKECLMVQ